jgi:hypothetical protein
MAIVLFSPTAGVALSSAAGVALSPAAGVVLSPTAVPQLTERQFPHAGVPEIVNCRSASYVTLGDQQTSLQWLCRFFSQVGALAIFHAHIHAFAAWLQGNAQVTISGTPA